jgi:hypothetical protein
MVRIIRNRLKGTILEPLIALMIILFSLTASFTVVLQVNQRNNIRQLVRAGVCADRVMNMTTAEKRYLSEEIEDNGLRIEKEISWYSSEDQLIRIAILVKDNKGRLLAKRQKIIIADETQSIE